MERGGSDENGSDNEVESMGVDAGGGVVVETALCRAWGTVLVPVVMVLEVCGGVFVFILDLSFW